MSGKSGLVALGVAVCLIWLGLISWRLAAENATVRREFAELSAETAASKEALRASADTVEIKEEFSREVARLRVDMTVQRARMEEIEARVAAATEDIAARQEQTAAALEVGIAGLERLWVEKAALAMALPAEHLAEGYSLPWQGDEFIPLRPEGEGVMMVEDGAVSFRAGGMLRTPGPATAISMRLAADNEMSVLVDMKPASLTQTGPARIVTNSRGTQERNFTIGQEGSRVSVRLRTTSTTPNGVEPHLESLDGALTGDRQTLVFVRHGEENLLYIDGELDSRLVVTGDLTSWNHTFPLALGNEIEEDRTWEGELYRVVFFNRALDEDEVAIISGR